MLRKLYLKKPLIYRTICLFLSKIISLIYFSSIIIVGSILFLVLRYALREVLSPKMYFSFIVLILMLVIFLGKILFLKKKRIKGLFLEEKKYKKLDEMVKELTKKFKGTSIDEIVICESYKVQIVTQYSFGLWGVRSSSLVIGLPILIGFSEKELEKMISLTICRHSRKHKRYHKKITRTYFKLDNIFGDGKDLIKTNRIFNLVLLRLLKRFYNFYREAIAMEFSNILIESDKMFLNKYTKTELANILLKRYVHKYLVKNIFMKEVNRAMDMNALPPKNYFTVMNEYLNNDVAPKDIRNALKDFKNYDTQDILYKGTYLYRVRRLKYNSEDFQYEFGESSAKLFGKNYKKILKKFDEIWYKKNSAIWEKTIKLRMKEVREYENLLEKFSIYAIREFEFERFIELREKYAGISTAIVEGKKLCIAYPKSEEIRYIVGKLLLKGNNHQGISYIKAAIDINPFIALSGYSCVISYCIRKGDYKTANFYKKEYKAFKADYKTALKERKKPRLKSRYYDKLDIDIENAVHIKEILKEKDYIKTAYISKIKVKKFKNIPHYILWLEYKSNFFTMEYVLSEEDKRLEKALSMKNITIVHLNGDNFYMKYPLKKIEKQKIII